MTRKQTKKPEMWRRIVPKIKLCENGTVTVSGIPWSHFRDLLAAAAGNMYQRAIKQQDQPVDDFEKFWTKSQIWVCKSLDDQIHEIIAATYPPPSKEEQIAKRKEQVESNRRFNEYLDQILQVPAEQKEPPV